MHPVLEAAYKAAGKQFLASRAALGHVVDPHLSPRSLVDIALWLPSLFDRGELEIADALARARAYRDEPQRARDYPYSLGNTRYPNEALSVALLAEAAALRMTRNPPATRTAVAAAARISVRQLRSRGSNIGDFLDELDAQLLRAECAAAIEPYASGRGASVDRVLWRGVAGDRCRHFLASLTGEETYGLLTKHKSRWRWFEGGLDELLATVPDEYFEDAVRSAEVVRCRRPT